MTESNTSGLNLYLDATCVIGSDTVHTVSIEVQDDTGTGFKPLDLSDYFVRFRVLGSPEADAEILLEKMITQNTSYENYGQIYDAGGGQFSFAISADESRMLGKGSFPINLALMFASEDNEPEFAYDLTLGNQKYEFSRINIVQV